MKNIFLILCVFSISFSTFSQEKTVKGPIFEDFGQVFKIGNPDLLLDKDKTYKIIFDAYTDGENIEKINPSINTVARFINMHAQHGIKLEDMKIILVLHGKATKNVLNDASFMEKYKTANPNLKLIAALKKAGVKTYVCGQSFTYHGFNKNDLSTNAEMSLSALTALVYYQTNGYQLISFN